MKKHDPKEEINICLKIWEEKGGCTFGGKTKCEECAAPYVLLKMINGELLHGDIQRLSLDDWRTKINSLLD